VDRGLITFARASWIPALTARLSSAITPDAQCRDQLRGGDQPELDIGAVLLRHRALSPDKLQAVVQWAVIDAVVVLTVPLADESFVSDIRFRAPSAHWAAAYSRLRVDAVRAEAQRRADRMARYRLTRTVPIALCDVDRSSILVRRDLWAVACRITGALSAQGARAAVWPGPL